MVVFSADELQRTSEWCKSALIGKVMGRSFPLEFVQKEMRIRWKVEGEFHVFPLSMGFLLFSLPSEAVRSKGLEKGLWSLASQLLALERWRPTFKPSKDSLRNVNIW